MEAKINHIPVNFIGQKHIILSNIHKIDQHTDINPSIYSNIVILLQTNIAIRMNTIIYEQVPQNAENSFFYRRCTSWYKAAIGYHQHPELEIGCVIKGSGQRITDDFIEHFEDGDIIIIPSNVPHCWIYNKLSSQAEETVEEAFIQFPPCFLERLARFANEFQEIASFYSDLKQCLSVQGETLKEVRRILLAFENYNEQQRLLGLLQILTLAFYSKETKAIGTKTFDGTTTHKNQQRLQAVYKYIAENYRRKITLDEIAGHIAMNKNAFCAFFKKSTNEPFIVYLNRFRLQMAINMLNRTERNISEIAYEVGFSDIPYFNRCFKKEYGISPAEYRNKYNK